MTDIDDQKSVEARLWKEIAKGRFGMLGLVATANPQHFQPMTAYPEPDAGKIWFFTRDETDLAKAVRAGQGKAMFTFQSKDQDLQACLGGELALDPDTDRIAKYWNPVAAAWYPEGKDDPRLTLLRFDLDHAAVWLTEAGPARFAFEIARANLTGSQPDLGGRSDVHFT